MESNDRRSDIKKSSKHMSDVDISSCKPCSVVLERLTEEEVKNLSSGNDLRRRNERVNRWKNSALTKRRSSRRTLPPTRHKSTLWKRSAKKARSQNIKEVSRDSSESEANKQANSVVHKQPKKVKRQISIVGTSESDSEAVAKRIEEYRKFLCQEKLSGYNSASHQPRREDNGIEISQKKDLEELKGSENSFQHDKSKLSASKRPKLSLEKKSSTREVEESGDTSSIVSNQTSLKDSKLEILPPKRFSLSLKKKKNNLNDAEFSEEDSHRKISLPESSDEIFDTPKIDTSCMKYFLKRKIVDIPHAEPSASKLTKYDKTQHYNDENIDKVISTLDENNRSKCPDSKVEHNRISEQELSPEVGKKVLNVKNLRVSLVKLERMGNLAAHEQKSSLKPLDHYIAVSEKSRDSRSQIVETKPEHKVEKSPSKSRSTKITDYFFKIDNRTSSSDNDKSNHTKPDKDLVLKERFGICKDPVVALVDLKQQKTPVSEYLVSDTKELTQEPCSSNDCNSKSTTAISPSSSSVSPSNKLSSTFGEPSTNDEQSPTCVTHLHSADDRQEKELPSLSQSPISPKNPKTQKSLPLRTTNGRFVKTRKPKSRRDEEVLNRSRVEDQEVSENVSTTGKRLSRPSTEEQPSLIEPNKVTKHSVDKTTPKSLKIVSSQSPNLTRTPAKRLDLITDDLNMNETRSPMIEINSNSSRIDRVQEEQHTMTENSSEVLADRNEPQEKSADTTDVDKNSNTVRDQRVTVIKSPIISGHSSPCVKEKIQRCIPVNSMTFISREMVDDNSSWIDVDRTLHFVNATNTTGKNCTVQGEESPQNLPIEDTQIVTKNMPKTISDTSFPVLELDSQATEKNLSAELSASKNIEPQSKTSGLIHKEIGETQRSDSVLETERSLSSIKISGTISTEESSMDPKTSKEVRESSSTVIEYLISNAAENVSPLRFASKNVESYSSELNMLVQKKIGDIHSSESSVPRTEISASISPIEDSSENADQNRENSKIQTNLGTDQDEGDLLIDIPESDSDLPSAESVVSSNLCTDGKSLVDEAAEDKEILVNKKCIMCKKTFRHLSSLEKHLQVHAKHPEECCRICGKPFANEVKIQHYLEHCVRDESKYSTCHVCDKEFKKGSGLTTHMRSKHNIQSKSKRRKTTPKNNKCTVCQLACSSAEDLFTHMRSHNGQELQDAYEVAKAEQRDRQNSIIFGENKSRDTPEKEKTVEKERAASESAEANNTSKDAEISVCMCHKEERLEISGGVIIEVALACVQCKTFFKTSKCFKDHYSNTSCTWSYNTVVTPKLFCNQCCEILNSLGELHSHLKKHDKIDVEMKTSFLCKRCNMFYFGIGDLFYAHWFEHCNNPLYVADHRAFPNNMRVNIVEPESTENTATDEPTQSLFIAEHQCHACQTPFQTEMEFKKHLSSSTSCSAKATETPKLYYKLICSMCNKEYSDKSTFDNHIEEHDDIRDFLQGPKGLGSSADRHRLTCSFCKTSYGTVSKYEEHLIRHKIMQEKFFCNYCTLMMDSLEDFERHCVEHKGTPEKPVTCKVVFAKAKFHCEPCILRFDNQTLLDEHLATHRNATTSDSKLVKDSTTEMLSVIAKRSPAYLPCKQQSNNILTSGTNFSIRDGDASGELAVNTVVIDLSDDSNSTDIEILEEVGIKQGEAIDETVVENNSDQQEQRTEDTQETEKPVFLRVKNLKELLPFDCKLCKAEFDTPSNLSKHICAPNIAPAQVSSQVVTPAQTSNQAVIPAKEKDFNYFCTICKKYQCDNDADWNLHILSHFPLQCSPTFSESWYGVSKQSHGQKEFTCKICGQFKSLTMHTMRHHFIIVHPNIYRPSFKCRVCQTFQTEVEQEIRRHESLHFQQPSSSLMKLINSNNNLSSLQPVENSNNSQQLVSTPTTTSSASLSQLSSINNARQNSSVSSSPGNNSAMFQVMRNFTTQQSGQIPPVSTSGDIASFIQVLRNFTNSQQTLQASPLNTSSNTPSLLQSMPNFTTSQQPVQSPSLTSSSKSSSTFKSVQNFNNFEQVQIAPAAGSASNSSTLQSTQNLNNQQPLIQPSSVTSSGNNSSPLQSIQNSTNPQQLVQLQPVTSSANLSLLQSAQRFNITQQPRSIPSLISLNNLLPSQPIDNSNNYQQPVLNASVAGTADNSSSVPQVQNSISQQPLPPVNNWNQFQPPTSGSPVISTANNLSSFPPIDNSQWLTTAAGTLQIQINNTPPFNNISNMMHTVPLYVANVVYCCRICKSFKCSSVQELKAHESVHDVDQMAEPIQKYYPCNVCANIFYSSEDQLKSHMEIYHNNEQLNVAKIQTPYNANITQIKCRNCLQIFDSSVQLIQHMYTCHKFPNQQQDNTQYQNVHNYSCPTCSTIFVNETFLRDHVRRTHPEVKLPRSKANDGKNLYQCDTCGLLLISEETLSYHMKSHSIGNGL